MRTEEDAGLGAACEAYVVSYRACMANMATPDVAEARVTALRESLQRAAPGKPAGALEQTCTDAKQQLQTSCR
jgi:hypothetical protein